MFLMQARSSSSGQLVTWPTSTPDWAGDSFPGPGSPLHIAVAQTEASEGSGRLKTTDNSVKRVRRYPVGDGTVLSLRGIVTVQSSNGSGAVRGEWEIKACYGRVSGALAPEYAPIITPLFTVGSPPDPTLTQNGNTDVDLNVTGIAATALTWKISEFSL